MNVYYGYIHIPTHEIKQRKNLIHDNTFQLSIQRYALWHEKHECDMPKNEEKDI